MILQVDFIKSNLYKSLESIIAARQPYGTARLTTMKTKQLIESWKNADATQQSDSPANNVDVNESAMSEITGGVNSTLSGECNGTGKSCWDILKDIFSF